jgi:hypothetical protein
MQNTDSRTTIIPGMQYRRAPEAIEGLCELYGFSKHARAKTTLSLTRN